MRRIDEIITILQAYKEGKKVQVKSGAQLIWADDENPIWDFWHCEYRVKHEPREWQVWVDPSGVISQFGNHSGKGIATPIKVREVIE